jgi:hypothetical protein
VELPVSRTSAYIYNTSGNRVMRGTFKIGERRRAVLSLRFPWGGNVLIAACFVAISIFTAAQVPAHEPPSPQQAKADEAKAEKEGESGACSANADALASRIRESAAREAGEHLEKISEENGEGASATNLTLQAPPTRDSTRKKVQGGEPAADVRQESHREEPGRLNTGSPRQCTLGKGSRETELSP